MKFNKALIEEVEIVNHGVAQSNVKAFTIDGKGPFSIDDIGKVKGSNYYSQLYSALTNSAVRMTMSKFINSIDKNDPKYGDIRIVGEGDVILYDENGVKLATITKQQQSQGALTTNKVLGR